MNIDNIEVSFFTSECALFEYAIKDNDNFFREVSHFGMVGHICVLLFVL